MGTGKNTRSEINSFDFVFTLWFTLWFIISFEGVTSLFDVCIKVLVDNIDGELVGVCLSVVHVFSKLLQSTSLS